MSEFEKQSDSDLEKALEEKRKRLREFRFEISGAGATDVKEARKHKKDIARILTELRKRELETS